jgi:hypothetical protein
MRSAISQRIGRGANVGQAISMTTSGLRSSHPIPENIGDQARSSMDWPTQLQGLAEVALAVFLGGVIGMNARRRTSPPVFADTCASRAQRLCLLD